MLVAVSSGCRRCQHSGTSCHIPARLDDDWIGLAVLAVPFYYLKQSNIIACIIIGIVVGSFELDVEWHLSVNTGSAIIELGILFLLFMVGS